LRVYYCKEKYVLIPNKIIFFGSKKPPYISFKIGKMTASLIKSLSVATEGRLVSGGVNIYSIPWLSVVHLFDDDAQCSRSCPWTTCHSRVCACTALSPSSRSRSWRAELEILRCEEMLRTICCSLLLSSSQKCTMSENL